MTREEAIKALERAEDCAGIQCVNNCVDAYISPYLLKAIDFAVSALREQEERESVWHNAKDSPPKKPGLYYGKNDDTDSMYLCQYRDGVWTLDAYPETRMHVIKWAYYNAIAQEQEQEQWWWIPVTERLPEVGGTYLVYTERGTVYASHFYEKKVFRDDYVREPQWSRRGEVKVTHWMPMPKPPVEDEK